MSVSFRIELDREDDGRWIAEIRDLPAPIGCRPLLGSRSRGRSSLHSPDRLPVRSEPSDPRQEGPAGRRAPVPRISRSECLGVPTCRRRDVLLRLTRPLLLDCLSVNQISHVLFHVSARHTHVSCRRGPAPPRDTEGVHDHLLAAPSRTDPNIGGLTFRATPGLHPESPVLCRRDPPSLSAQLPSGGCPPLPGWPATGSPARRERATSRAYCRRRAWCRQGPLHTVSRRAQRQSRPGNPDAGLTSHFGCQAEGGSWRVDNASRVSMGGTGRRSPQ